MVDKIITREFFENDYVALADYRAEEVRIGFASCSEGITLTMEELDEFVRFVDEVRKAVNV